MQEVVVILLSVILLLMVLLWVMYKLGYKKGFYEKELFWQENIGKIRRDIADKQRTGIKGKLTEVFAPFLPGFKYKASEAKFLGDPIDYIIFDGLDDRKIKGLRFVEVKTNKSGLKDVQKQIKELIESLDDSRISFDEFRFFEDKEE